jgi:hypothetical protein
MREHMLLVEQQFGLFEGVEASEVILSLVHQTPWVVPNH